MTVKLEKVDDKTAYENLLVKYAELENKIADIKANCDLAIEGRDIKIKELEQKLEQTEEDLADYQFNYPTIKELTEGTCFAHLKSLEKENGELKADNDARKFAMGMSEKVEEQLREQIKQIEKVSDYNADQLTKAKEIISAFVEWANWQGANCPNFKDIQSKAEQFLKADVGTKNYEEQDKILKTRLL